MTARMAPGSSLQCDERRDGDGRCRVAGDRLEHDGARIETGALDFLADEKAVIVVAEQDRRARNPASLARRFSVAARKLELWPLKKRMNCFGYIARDRGQSRVPEPPESMTG